ncbi:MAG: ABC transporter permease [SAR324 cluster bacterium]|nr:ABC transporter permease [SAR324 cluster bacterium]MBL7034610.1 ABC transporter permease [SAR324 cluster bacterium]
MLWKLAWRNLWRNRTRTWLSSLVIAIGLVAMIFMDTMMVGMNANMVKNATDSLMGHAQVHALGFRDEQDVKLTINDLEKTLLQLEKHPDLKARSMRIVTQSMLSSAGGGEPVLSLGIDPEEERLLSKFDEAIVEGKYLDSVSSQKIILGWKLADKLDLGLGDRLVLTAADAESGEMVQELFRLSGIFKTGEEQMDASMVLVGRKTLQTMLKLEGRVHQIALRYANLSQDGVPVNPPEKPELSSKNELLLWTELMPSLYMISQMTDLSMAIMGTILFLIIALGITNTLLMGLYERMFEFGVIKSIGTTPWQAARLMLYEAVCLGLISIIVGLIFAVFVTALFANYGIDYTGIEFSGVTFQEKIYPSYKWSRLVLYPFMSMGFTILAALYPAFKLWYMLPVEALRKRKF